MVLLLCQLSQTSASCNLQIHTAGQHLFISFSIVLLQLLLLGSSFLGGWGTSQGSVCGRGSDFKAYSTPDRCRAVLAAVWEMLAPPVCCVFVCLGFNATPGKLGIGSVPQERLGSRCLKQLSLLTVLPESLNVWLRHQPTMHCLVVGFEGLFPVT